jgi:hypothetical protein
MKRTTIALDERLLNRIRAKARREGRHFQDCANDLLRIGLERVDRPQRPIKLLPTFSLGSSSVDIADREALLDILDEDAQ